MSNNIHKRCAEIMAELGKNGEFEFWEEFKWLPKIKLEKRLKDILEDDVDEKYYLSDKMIDGFKNQNNNFKGHFEPHNKDDNHSKCLTSRYNKMGRTDPYLKEPNCTPAGLLDIKGNDSIRRVYDTKGLSPCLTTMEGGNRQPKIQVTGTYESTVPSAKVSLSIKKSVRDNFIRDYESIIKTNKKIWYSDCKSGFQDNKVCIEESACLRANNDNLFALDNNCRIRKLTPRECFRLQDFDDTFKFVVSNSQLYKQAGNSISVNISEMIFAQIESSRYKNMNVDSLF